MRRWLDCLLALVWAAGVVLFVLAWSAYARGGLA